MTDNPQKVLRGCVGRYLDALEDGHNIDAWLAALRIAYDASVKEQPTEERWIERVKLLEKRLDAIRRLVGGVG